MPAIPFIKTKIGTTHVVYLPNKNLYIQLEEPAWFIFDRTAKQQPTETIVRQFSQKFGTNGNDSLQFVKQIQNRLENKLNGSPAKIKTGPVIPANKPGCKPHFIHRYLVGEKFFIFHFETHELRGFIHPLIGHLETKITSAEPFIFELYNYKQNIVFRTNGKVQGSWKRDESHKVKGCIFIHFATAVYGKNSGDWLMTVHASAISDSTKTLLFPAKPGSGKTTIAALLAAKGFHLVSDDFVPVDKHFQAYPLPLAVSVKAGAEKLLAAGFPELENKKCVSVSSTKKGYYLPVSSKHYEKHVLPIFAFVFVEYNPSVDFHLEKLETTEGIPLLFEEAGIRPSAENAAVFFRKIQEVSFFRLTYSNTQKATNSVIQLFRHGQ